MDKELELREVQPVMSFAAMVVDSASAEYQDCDCDCDDGNIDNYMITAGALIEGQAK